MSTKVSQITVEELREMIGDVVEERLRALFGGAEDDLELNAELHELLQRQKKQVEAGERGEAFEDEVAKLGLS